MRTVVPKNEVRSNTGESLTMQAQVHVRSQHAKRGRSGFSGPDTYVAVTIAPDGVTVPYRLNRTVLGKRGIRLIYVGEGYRKHSGPKSALGKALSAAELIAREEQR